MLCAIGYIWPIAASHLCLCVFTCLAAPLNLQDDSVPPSLNYHLDDILLPDPNGDAQVHVRSELTWDQVFNCALYSYKLYVIIKDTTYAYQVYVYGRGENVAMNKKDLMRLLHHALSSGAQQAKYYFPNQQARPLWYEQYWLSIVLAILAINLFIWLVVKRKKDNCQRVIELPSSVRSTHRQKRSKRLKKKRVKQKIRPQG